MTEHLITAADSAANGDIPPHAELGGGQDAASGRINALRCAVGVLLAALIFPILGTAAGASPPGLLRKMAGTVEGDATVAAGTGCPVVRATSELAVEAGPGLGRATLQTDVCASLVPTVPGSGTFTLRTRLGTLTGTVVSMSPDVFASPLIVHGTLTPTSGTRALAHFDTPLLLDVAGVGLHFTGTLHPE